MSEMVSLSVPNLVMDELAESLRRCIPAIPAEGFLVLSVKNSRNRYLQLANGGARGFRAEVVGNAYLDEQEQLDDGQLAALTAMGWMPADPASGQINHYKEWPPPPPAEDISTFAALTLETILGVNRSDQLRYRCYDATGDIAMPDLNIEMERDALVPPWRYGAEFSIETVRAFIGNVIADMFDTEPADLPVDADGDIPLPRGSTVLYVGTVALEDTIEVRLTAPMLSVESSAALFETINDINLRSPIGSVVYVNGAVVAHYRVPAIILDAESLRYACNELSALADHFDEQLQARFGGTTALGPHPDKESTIPGYL